MIECMIECNVLWIYDKYSAVSVNQFCTDSSQVPRNFLELVEVSSESECVCRPHFQLLSVGNGRFGFEQFACFHTILW